MVKNDYAEWLKEMVEDPDTCYELSFSKLLDTLNHIEFVWSIPNDRNRAKDGVSLRYRYAYVHYLPKDCLDDAPCSVLEMMVALALKAESIMDDPKLGDRTASWFWSMIISMGLGSQSNLYYDRDYVLAKVDDMMYRRYEPNGANGGLFTLHHCSYDIREVELWCQLCWYLNEQSN